MIDFFHVDIPRTASTSVRSALQLETTPRHETAAMKRDRVGAGRWQRAFTFSVVRNPYSRLVSQYKHQADEQDFAEWVSRRYVQKDRSGGPDVDYWERLWEPQTHWLCEEGRVLVDYVGRFEDLQASWRFISQRVEWERDLPHVNAADDCTNWRTFYTPMTAAVMQNCFASDFEMFNYSTEMLS